MLYGVSGKKQTGKDLFCKIWNELLLEKPSEITDDVVSKLEDNIFNGGQNDESYIYEKHYYAKSLKQIACILFGCTLEDLENESFKSSTLPDEWLKYNNESVKTYRDFLQYAGTEMFRTMLNRDTWILSTFSTYKPSDNWIITDVRFPNEKKAIEDHGGKVIRIESPYVSKDNHSSETMLDAVEFEYVITNNMNFGEYVKSIFDVMRKEDIL